MFVQWLSQFISSFQNPSGKKSDIYPLYILSPMRLVLLADPLDNQSAGVHVYTKMLVEGLIRNNTGHELILIRERRDKNLTGVRQIVVPIRAFLSDLHRYVCSSSFRSSSGG
jgi:hypothetical protein